MPAGLLGNRFYGYREGGWHRLGHVNDTPQTGRQTLEMIGTVDVRLLPVVVDLNGDLVDVPDYQVIMRLPTPDDDYLRAFGVVSPQYVLLTPEDAVDAWDTVVKRPVETMGFIRNGAVLFITTELPGFNVRGDESKGYMMLSSPMTGEDTLSVSYVTTRVVCQNTWLVALAGATETYRIRHDTGAKYMLKSHLKDIYERFTFRHDAVQEALDILAAHRVSPEDEMLVLERAYPEPAVPVENCPPDVYEKRVEKWELDRMQVLEYRFTAGQLFQGEGTGMDLPATKGTAWGLFNAVTELANYGGRRVDPKARAQAVLFGSQGDVIKRAFDASLEISRN